MIKILYPIIVSISLFVIATIPIVFAAVQPWVWSLYCLPMIAGFILYLWSTIDQPVLPRVRLFKKSVAIFFIWTLFLCIPIPHPTLTVLSHTRGEILSRACGVKRQHPDLGNGQLFVKACTVLVGVSTQHGTFLSRGTESLHRTKNTQTRCLHYGRDRHTRGGIRLDSGAGTVHGCALG